MEHHTVVIDDLNVLGMSTAYCETCQWMGGDSPRDEAEKEAAEHREHPEQSELEEWTPEKHPMPGFRMR